MRAVLLITIAVLSASAQTPDYARAERFMPYDVTPLPKGPEYVTVDAPHATRETSSKAPAQAPDKRRTAFIRDYNLWVRDAAGKETQLTTDGVKDFGYATDNAGWTRTDRAILLWSPDSKKIATFQQDPQKGWRPVGGETHDHWVERMRNTATHLCRIRYFGDENRWSFAWYTYAHEKYEPSFLITGDAHGTPEEAFETSAQFL